MEHKKTTADLRGEVSALKREVTTLIENQAGTLHRIADLKKKNNELNHHPEEIRKASRVLEDKNNALELENATLKNKTTVLEGKMSSDWAEADARVSELQGRLARLEEEMEDWINKEVYDQFLNVLSGMMDAHPDLDYSFLPQFYQDIIQEWRTDALAVEAREVVPLADFSSSIETEEVIVLPGPKVATPDTAGLSAPLENAVAASTEMIEFVREEPVAKVIEGPIQAIE